MFRKRMNLRLFETDVQIIDRTGADTLIPEERAREIIQGVVTQSAVLSRGRKLPNMSSRTYKMPVLNMLPIAYFVNGDTGQKKTTKMAWDKKFITAEEIAVVVPIPESVLDDSDYDIWGEVRPRVEEAFGKVIDGAVIFGVNKPTSWRDDIVTTATTAGSIVTLTIKREKAVINNVEIPMSYNGLNAITPICVFSKKDQFGTGLDVPGAFKLYQFDILSSDTWEKIIDLLPALDGSGIPCLYDTVSETYFYNQGEGQFGYETFEGEVINE